MDCLTYPSIKRRKFGRRFLFPLWNSVILCNFQVPAVFMFCDCFSGGVVSNWWLRMLCWITKKMNMHLEWRAAWNMISDLSCHICSVYSDYIVTNLHIEYYFIYCFYSQYHILILLAVPQQYPWYEMQMVSWTTLPFPGIGMKCWRVVKICLIDATRSTGGCGGKQQDVTPATAAITATTKTSSTKREDVLLKEKVYS